LSGPASFVSVPSGLASSQLLVRASRTRPGQLALRVRRRVRPVAGPPFAPNVIETDRYDVVHFPSQLGEATRHPTIYQPWDLQHLHHPQFFTSDQLQTRAAVYRPCCERARFVLVASHFVRDDVVDAFGIEPDRVAVVPPGAPTALHETPPSYDAVPSSPFALYPAQAWKHKNHIRLLDAVALLRDRGTTVPVVCPGQPNLRLREVRRHAAGIGVDHLVTFPGHVSDAQLAGLYERARCLVFPSLFEGFGFPVLEAFMAGLPVACASATSLAELAGPAAIQFDATSTESIAAALHEVWEDDARRDELVSLGRARASRYTWEHLARSCRALYRAAAALPLEASDRTLLEAAGASA
ncbi:MAG TPA: glycosyltransferase family 1 protein, partial [Acidimicrobiales bacterium]|nr:glycosyltransferase family 1 protein [Acidimicrobiales bacterium]